MQRFTQTTPDGRTIPAHPAPGRHVEQPPPRHGAAEAAPDALTAFVAGTIASLPELPDDSGSRLCLQLFLLGAGEELKTRRAIADDIGFASAYSLLLERHGLPGNETLALIEALPELQRDANASRILRQGARTMTEWLGSHDRNSALHAGELLAQWRRESVCRRAD
ncbi:MAG: hypothetical protein K9M02_13635 [Thiohalocapsa sp.]|nr:hypothetical protein [Thiohalocapsa sp.]